MKIKATEDRVIIKPIPLDTVTKGGLHIPDNAVRRPTRGEVISVGEGRRATATGELIPVKIPIGATVMYPEPAGWGFMWDEVEYLVIRETDIMLWEPKR